MTIMPMTIVPFDTDAAILRGREQLLAAMNPGGHGPDDRRRRVAARTRQILRSATPTERVFFVDTLIAMEAVPDEIVEILLADAPSVALPLVETGGLSDRLLTALAERRGETSVQLALARRRRLPAAASDRLVAGGDRRVLLELARNADAALTAGAFEILADQAVDDPAIDAALSRRADLPAHVVDRRAHRPAALAAAWMRDRIDRERMRHHAG